MDEENRETPEEDTPETEEKVEEKQPQEVTNNDYMAAAILANGIIWFWMLSLNMFSGFTSRINPTLLVDFTYITFVLAGFISSQQVAKRSNRNQLIIALRSAIYSWAGSIIMMLSMMGNPTISFTLTVLVCLLAGAVAGSYMLIRFRINERRRQLAEASS
jgi:uncharacterized membrane protein YdbT with pleckstrin-like domain